MDIETAFLGHHVTILGKVSTENVANFKNDIKKIPDYSKAALLISTPGGDLSSFRELNNLIAGACIRFRGIGGRLVFSSGIGVLLSCDEQVAFQNTEFLHHRVTLSDGTPDLKGIHKESERILFEFYALRTKRPIDDIYQLADKRIRLPAYDAKEFGFIQDIIPCDYTQKTFQDFNRS